MPSSQALSMIWNASSSFSPWPKNSGAEPMPPKFPQPRMMRETSMPFPSCRRSIEGFSLRHDPTTLIVPLGRTLAPRSHITVHTSWRLRLPSTHDDRIARFRDGLRLGTFLPLLAWDPRRGWLTDPPARILAESAATPAADFD